jgi:hypothetical protein
VNKNRVLAPTASSQAHHRLTVNTSTTVNNNGGSANTNVRASTAAPSYTPPASTSNRNHILGRDPISMFVDTILQCRTEEWKKKVLALENLIESLDAQSEDARLNANNHNGNNYNDNGDDNMSVGGMSMASDISGISSPSAIGSGYGHNRARVRGGGAPVTGRVNVRRNLNGGVSSPLASSVPSRVRVLSGASSVGGSPSAFRSPSNVRTTPSNNKPLYKQPKELRRLCVPFHKLLNNLRSQVVKSACVTLEILSMKSGDAMRFLLKEILPDLISLHRQTLKVMHSYGETATMTIWQHVTLKYTHGVSLLVKEARQSKSKEVRCICIKYLGEIVHSWPTGTRDAGLNMHNNINAASTRRSAIPLTELDLQNITQTFVTALGDSSPDVRQAARMALVHSLRVKYPVKWNRWVVFPDTTLVSSERVRHSLLKSVEESVDVEIDAEHGQQANTTNHASPRHSAIFFETAASPLSMDGINSVITKKQTNGFRAVNKTHHHNTHNAASSETGVPPITNVVVHRNPFALSPNPTPNRHGIYAGYDAGETIKMTKRRARQSSVVLHRRLTRLSLAVQKVPPPQQQFPGSSTISGAAAAATTTDNGNHKISEEEADPNPSPVMAGESMDDINTKQAQSPQERTPQEVTPQEVSPQIQTMYTNILQMHKHHTAQMKLLMEQEIISTEAVEAKYHSTLMMISTGTIGANPSSASASDMIDMVVEYFDTMERGLDARNSLNVEFGKQLDEVVSCGGCEEKDPSDTKKKSNV